MIKSTVWCDTHKNQLIPRRKKIPTENVKSCAKDENNFKNGIAITTVTQLHASNFNYLTY